MTDRLSHVEPLIHAMQPRDPAIACPPPANDNLVALRLEASQLRAAARTAENPLLSDLLRTLASGCEARALAIEAQTDLLAGDLDVLATLPR